MIRHQWILAVCLLSAFSPSLSAQDDGSVLPFPPQPMDSVVKPSLQDSTMKWLAQPQRLPADAPSPSLIALPNIDNVVMETGVQPDPGRGARHGALRHGDD